MTLTDARAIRSRKALLDAALELASEKPIEEVIVDEVCERSGVSRATFYRHAQSPSSLLSEHLYEELRHSRMHFFTHFKDPSTFAEVMTESTSMLIEEIEKHKDLYRNSFKSNPSDMRTLMYNFLIEAVTKLTERTPEIEWSIGNYAPERPADEDVDYKVIRGYAGMFVGILDAWLLDDEVSASEFVEIFVEAATPLLDS